MKWIKRIEYLWFVLGVIIVLFVIVELFAFFAAKIKIYNPHDPRADLPVYKNFDQRIEFWREQAKTWKNLQYIPYRMWSRPAFLGKWTNVNSLGDRVTHYNVDENMEGAKKIFMFGGSTIWGTGSPDWQTIPSYVAKLLNEENPRYLVRNYGETGYVASQGLNRLISEIKQGNIPDLVVFYSGINDASTGARALLALETPSYHLYMEQFKRTFKRSKRGMLCSIFEASYTFRAINLLKDKLLPAQGLRWEETIEEDDLREAVDKTTQSWFTNYKIASSIGKEYDFGVILILQPNLSSGSKKFQDYEKKFLEGGLGSIDAVYDRIREIIIETNPVGVYDLSDVFREVDEPVYIDWAHIGPLGNYYVARKIIEIIKYEGY